MVTEHGRPQHGEGAKTLVKLSAGEELCHALKGTFSRLDHEVGLIPKSLLISTEMQLALSSAPINYASLSTAIGRSSQQHRCLSLTPIQSTWSH